MKKNKPKGVSQKTEKMTSPKTGAGSKAGIAGAGSKSGNAGQADEGHFNRRVAAARGSSWRKKLALGKLMHPQNPSELRKKRVVKGYSQHDIAARLSLTASTYGEIERGKRAVKEEKAKAIAAFFKIPIAKLFSPHKKYPKKFVAIRVSP